MENAKLKKRSCFMESWKRSVWEIFSQETAKISVGFGETSGN